MITAAAAGKTQEDGLQMLARGGRLSAFGGLPKDKPNITVDANLVHYRELTIVGANGSSPDHNKQALAMIASGEVPVQRPDHRPAAARPRPRRDRHRGQGRGDQGDHRTLSRDRAAGHRLPAAQPTTHEPAHAHQRADPALVTEGIDVATHVEEGASRTGGARIAVQKFGTFLSGMIMPNIAAFIAWGLITAFFIEKGWLPVPGLGGFGLNAEGKENTGLVGPMIRYMLPLLIAGQGGRMVYGVRGGVVAVVATMGVIISSEQPQFLGAMVMGPLAAWIMKQLDKLWDGKIKPGFEMLVNNFSAGIASALLAVVGFFAFGPVFAGISQALGAGVDWLIAHSLLPLASA